MGQDYQQPRPMTLKELSNMRKVKNKRIIVSFILPFLLVGMYYGLYSLVGYLMPWSILPDINGMGTTTDDPTYAGIWVSIIMIIGGVILGFNLFDRCED